MAGHKGKKKHRMPKTSKAYHQRLHAQQRLRERFGIDLTHADYADMVRQIQTGAAEFIERQSNRVTKFWVTIHDQRLPVVYDKQRSTIVTVLRPEWMVQCPTTA